MANNIFIVCTPFHLLTSFILSRTVYEGDHNYLALLHPHGYDSWHKDPLLRFMTSREAGYEAVYPLVTWMTKRAREKSLRKQAEQARAMVGPVKMDRAFLASDTGRQTQLFVALLGLKSYIRYDDGMYSYYNKDRKRPLSHTLFHQAMLRLMAWAAGIHSDLAFHVSSMGAASAGLGDYLYLPPLLRRPSPKVYEVSAAMIARAMDVLKGKGLLNRELSGKRYVMYLSQPITEQGKLSFDDEKECLRFCLSRFASGQRLIYKPHPNDSPYKVNYVRTHFPEVLINDSKVPVELILCKEPAIRTVISYQSTTLLIAPKFTGGGIRCISLADWYRKPIHQAYRDIMEEAGVEFAGRSDQNVFGKEIPRHGSQPFERKAK